VGNTIPFAPAGDAGAANFAGMVGAAVNRGVLFDATRWGEASPPDTGYPEAYYQAQPDSNAGEFNHYAKVLHGLSVDGPCYGHSYDNFFGQASALSVSGGDSVTVTVLPFD